jgi:apolipoprotein N-acyltransferase
VLRPTRAEAAAALASGALFAIAFPPIPLVVPAFLCLVPLALAIVRQADEGGAVRDAARTGFWFGVVGYGASLYWIAIALAIFTKLAFLGYVASVLVMAVISAAGAAALFCARRVSRLPMAILLPTVWVALELLINYLPDLAFPWLPLGLATARYPLVAQVADLSSVRGVSFWIAATNGLLVDAYLLRGRRRAVLTRAATIAAFAALVAGYGYWRLSTVRLRDLAPIAIVQPNIPQEEKWQQENQSRIIGLLSALTRERVAHADDALIVWPEVALPGFLNDHADWRDTLKTLSTIEGTPIITGVLDAQFSSPTDYEYYNAAVLVDAHGRIGTQPPYYKAYLVPIVERVPFVNPRWFRSLKYFGGFGRGTSTRPFVFPFGRVGVLICYESIFPQVSRAYRRNGADALLNITNDAWFGRSLAPYQHEAHLALRAIENRVGIVRSANTGISEYIDPLGRVHGATELFVEASRSYRVQTTSERTLYTRVGDWLSVLGTIATLGLVLWDRVQRRRAPPPAGPADI